MFNSKDPIIKQVEKIAVYAAKLTAIIKKKTGISSNYVLYESLFYFYSLENILFSKYGVDVIKPLTQKLFQSLEATNKLDYLNMKSLINVTCYKRYKTYLEIFEKNNKNLNSDFFMDCFMYMSELFIFIQENNNFSTSKPLSNNEWINISVLDESYVLIVRALAKNINMFLRFIKI